MSPGVSFAPLPSGAPSSGATWPRCSAMTRAIPSGSESTRCGPNPSGRPPPMPVSCATISSSRRLVDSGDGIRRASEIRRPIASATAIVSDPALPTETNTSNGSPSPCSFTTMYAVPSGVSTRYVRPVRLRGRGLTTAGGGAAASPRLSPLPAFVPTWSTPSLHPSRNTVMPRQPSSQARR